MNLLARLDAIRQEVCPGEDDSLNIRLQQDLASVDITVNGVEMRYSVGIGIDDPDESIEAAVREAIESAPPDDGGEAPVDDAGAGGPVDGGSAPPEDSPMVRGESQRGGRAASLVERLIRRG